MEVVAVLSGQADVARVGPCHRGEVGVGEVNTRVDDGDDVVLCVIGHGLLVAFPCCGGGDAGLVIIVQAVLPSLVVGAVRFHRGEGGDGVGLRGNDTIEVFELGDELLGAARFAFDERHTDIVAFGNVRTVRCAIGAL